MPHVNDRNLSALGLSLSGEVGRLRALWLSQRGDAWHPVAAVAQRVAVNARYPFSPVMTGLVAALLSIPGFIIVFLVLLVADVAVLAPLDVFLGPLGALTVPATVGIVTALVTVWRRRRDRSGSSHR